MPRTAIDDVLESFHAAAARADETALFACLTDDAVFLGTDAKERWPGDEFRRYVSDRFRAGRGWTMTSARRDVTVRGDVAWFDEDLSHAKYGALRGSGVLVRGGDGAWRIAQYNLTFTIPNERVDAMQQIVFCD